MNILVAGFGIDALLGTLLTNSTAPEPPCQPGKVICPPLPDYDGEYGAELNQELTALSTSTAIIREHRDYMKLLAHLARNCGTA